MKKRLKLTIHLILFSILTLSLTGCLEMISGTGTGNPLSAEDPYSALPGVGGEILSASEELLFGICETLADCNEDLEYDSCLESLSSGPELVEALSYSVQDFASYNEFMDAEAEGVLSVDDEFRKTCSTGLVSVAQCDDPDLTNAYDSNREEKYSGLGVLLSKEQLGCQKVFRIKE